MSPPDDAPCLLFDLGGVLVDVDLPKLKAGMARVFKVDESAIEWALFETGLKRAFDTGLIDQTTFVWTLKDALGKPDVKDIRVAAAWCDLFTERREAASLLGHLSQSCWLYICSNTDPLHAAYLRDTYDWTGLFTDAWLSFEAGVAKPDPAYYEGALNAFGVDRSRALFFDDREENVVAAQSVGLEAVHVTDPQTVGRSLRRLGLL